MPTALERASQIVTRVLAQIENADIDVAVHSITGAVDGVNELVRSPEVQPGRRRGPRSAGVDPAPERHGAADGQGRRGDERRRTRLPAPSRCCARRSPDVDRHGGAAERRAHADARATSARRPAASGTSPATSSAIPTRSWSDGPDRETVCPPVRRRRIGDVRGRRTRGVVRLPARSGPDSVLRPRRERSRLPAPTRLVCDRSRPHRDARLPAAPRARDPGGHGGPVRARRSLGRAAPGALRPCARPGPRRAGRGPHRAVPVVPRRAARPGRARRRDLVRGGRRREREARRVLEHSAARVEPRSCRDDCSSIVEPVDERGAQAQVAALSRALGELARRVASAIPSCRRTSERSGG